MNILRAAIFYGSAALIVACAGTGIENSNVRDIRPGHHPALTSEEAGLWMTMDRREEALKTSGMLVRDKGINAYLNEVVCRIAGDLCKDIRVYLVQIPYMNATMAPNGVMEIWTGTLLRVQNEAQLAYIIGHEIAHYRKRHALKTIRTARSMSAVLATIQIAAHAGRADYAGNAAGIVARGAYLKYSRDFEREADELGLNRMAACGYDPLQAPKLWKGLEEEKKASKETTPMIFFSTHPSSEERTASLTRQAEQSKKIDSSGVVGRSPYRNAVGPLLTRLLRDEVRRRRYAGTMVILNRLIASGWAQGRDLFYRGELYRLRNGPGDREKAEKSYDAALQYGDAPAETYRALGILYMKSGDLPEAKKEFRRYLDARPHAFDRMLIESYLATKEG